MSYRELYCNKFNGFLNSSCDYKDAKFVIVGYPFDSTSTYVTGSRFGPEAIRRASLNLETFDLRTQRDVSELKIADIGDIVVDYSNVEENIKTLDKVVSEIYNDNKVPIILGGEHTVTLGAVKSLKNFSILCFDAHLDLRNEYSGAKISHSTTMRRILENTNINKIIYVGTRAVCKEEFEFSKKDTRVKIISMDSIEIKGPINIIKIFNKELEDNENLYITVDMDVFDPAFAPNVGNPEPGGLDFNSFKKLINNIDHKIVGFDINEIAPTHITDITAIYAAKIIFKILKQVK